MYSYYGIEWMNVDFEMCDWVVGLNEGLWFCGVFLGIWFDMVIFYFLYNLK